MKKRKQAEKRMLNAKAELEKVLELIGEEDRDGQALECAIDSLEAALIENKLALEGAENDEA